MNAGILAVWFVAFACIMAATCWRVLAQRARGRRCTAVVTGKCIGAQDGTWVHGDAGDETKVSRPGYRYEYGGRTYESAAGVATMLFERSPAAANLGENVELRVNPENPEEVYDPSYEKWFAKYRVIWGVVSCIGIFVLVKVLSLLG